MDDPASHVGLQEMSDTARSCYVSLHVAACSVLRQRHAAAAYFPSWPRGLNGLERDQ